MEVFFRELQFCCLNDFVIYEKDKVMKNKKKKFVFLIIIFILIALLCIFMQVQIKKYHDTHTWATVETNARWINENDEQVGASGSIELLKGDRIDSYLGFFTVIDISHDGTIVIDLNSDEFSDGNGNEVLTDIIHLNETKTYYKGSKDKYTTVTVISNRYQ